MNFTWDILSIIGGFAILIYSSIVAVDNAVILAEAWGIKQSFIGAVILGLGTSLPELSISLGAIRKGAFRLSVGNLIGSNIFDILLVLGVGSSISGFIVNRSLLSFDIPFLFITSCLVVFFFWTKGKLEKKESIMLLLIYLAYVVFKFKGF